MKLSLTVGLLTTLGVLASHGARSSEQIQTVTITAHRPHTMAAQRATKVLAAAEEAMKRYFERDALTTRVSNLWIFPTNDQNSVFVQYELRDAKGEISRQQLALIELQGGEITRIVDLAALPATRVASAGFR